MFASQNQDLSRFSQWVLFFIFCFVWYAGCYFGRFSHRLARFFCKVHPWTLPSGPAVRCANSFPTNLSFVCPKESDQRKGTPALDLALRDCPRQSVKNGPRRNSLTLFPQTTARICRFFSLFLGGVPKGIQTQPHPTVCRSGPIPCGDAEMHRRMRRTRNGV